MVGPITPEALFFDEESCPGVMLALFVRLVLRGGLIVFFFFPLPLFSGAIGPIFQGLAEMA